MKNVKKPSILKSFIKKVWIFDEVITHGDLNRIEEGIEQAIASSGDTGTGGALTSHMNDTTNPHKVTAVQTGAAPTVHNHDAGAINSGTMAIARLPVGSTSSTVARGDHTHSSSQNTAPAMPASGATGTTSANAGLSWSAIVDESQGWEARVTRSSSARRIGDIVELCVVLSRTSNQNLSQAPLNYTLPEAFRPRAVAIFQFSQIFHGTDANAQLLIDHLGRLSVDFASDATTGNMIVVATYFTGG